MFCEASAIVRRNVLDARSRIKCRATAPRYGKTGAIRTPRSLTPERGSELCAHQQPPPIAKLLIRWTTSIPETIQCFSRYAT